tara:strand:- start:995 stop:1132 length:138 start_codon:yes stop_codon:yes gene_type:complete
MAEEEKEEEEEVIVYEFVEKKPDKVWRRNPKFTQPVHKGEDSNAD